MGIAPPARAMGVATRWGRRTGFYPHLNLQGQYNSGFSGANAEVNLWNGAMDLNENLHRGTHSPECRSGQRL